MYYLKELSSMAWPDRHDNGNSFIQQYLTNYLFKKCRINRGKNFVPSRERGPPCTHRPAVEL
jgi:hypothetical protein